jgi:hypothetical protein
MSATTARPRRGGARHGPRRAPGRVRPPPRQADRSGHPVTPSRRPSRDPQRQSPEARGRASPVSQPLRRVLNGDRAARRVEAHGPPGGPPRAIPRPAPTVSASANRTAGQQDEDSPRACPGTARPPPTAPKLPVAPARRRPGTSQDAAADHAVVRAASGTDSTCGRSRVRRPRHEPGRVEPAEGDAGNRRGRRGKPRERWQGPRAACLPRGLTEHWESAS